MTEAPHNPAGDGLEDDGPVRTEAEIARELRLRPAAPKVTRISRKTLVTLGAVGAVAVLGAAFVALQPGRKSGPPPELVDTQSKARADKLATLPRDYASLQRTVPQLGPPLPGDLGRPIIAAENAGQPIVATTPGAAAATSGAPVDPMVQQRQQEREGARLSKLFAGAGEGGSGPAAGSAVASDSPNGLAALADRVTLPTSPTDTEAHQSGQDHKLAFIDASVVKEAVSGERLAPPASAYIVQAGSVISGALVTGLRSDLPGVITGQVTQDVYDSPTGRFLLIPQGSKLIGAYDSQVAFGQSRVLMVWTRLILPGGKSIGLERQAGSDAQGFSGLQDMVDDHWGQLLKGAILSTLLSVGAQAGTTNSENNLAQALRGGAAQSFSQTGEQVVARELNVQPTLTIRPGYRVTIVVGHDLVLEPYRR